MEKDFPCRLEFCHKKIEYDILCRIVLCSQLKPAQAPWLWILLTLGLLTAAATAVGSLFLVYRQRGQAFLLSNEEDHQNQGADQIQGEEQDQAGQGPADGGNGAQEDDDVSRRADGQRGIYNYFGADFGDLRPFVSVRGQDNRSISDTVAASGMANMQYRSDV